MGQTGIDMHVMYAHIFICETPCNRNGHDTLHLYSNYSSKDLKGFCSHYWIHPCYVLVKWRWGEDYSSHFIKEEADAPRGSWIGQVHIVNHLFAQNHGGAEISPKWSLHLLVLSTDFCQDNGSVSQPCVCDSDHQVVSVQGGVRTGGERFTSVGYFTSPSRGCCRPHSYGQIQGSRQQREGNSSCHHQTRTKSQGSVSITDIYWTPQCTWKTPIHSVIYLTTTLWAGWYFLAKVRNTLRDTGWLVPGHITHKFTLRIWTYFCWFE